LASGLLNAAQDNLSVVFNTNEASVMKVLDSVIDWISDIAGETDSKHSGTFSTILSGGFLFLMILMLLI
jgi:hypothetical protein